MANITEIKKKDTQNNGNPNPEEVKEPGKVRKFFGAIGRGLKQAWESPIATAIGAAIGTGVTIGVTAFLNHRKGDHSDENPVEELLPDPEEAYTTDDVVND